jgi:hypothetical protein
LKDRHDLKFSLVTVLIALGLSCFTGMVIISIGLGPATPGLERVAAPFVCGRNLLQLNTENFVYGGTSGYFITWYCVDGKTGGKQDVTAQTIFAAGLFYSAVVLILLIGWSSWAAASKHGVKKSKDPSAP